MLEIYVNFTQKRKMDVKMLSLNEPFVLFYALINRCIKKTKRRQDGRIEINTKSQIRRSTGI